METNHVSAGATAQADADDIPLIVKLVENPKFDLPFVDILRAQLVSKNMIWFMPYWGGECYWLMKPL